ncbi:MAG TPA: transglutaminase family protein [Acidobacteriaceae bacterium]|jgi:transglutaminase-like putative cysteine protease|nr:transglutaminase family protein [Acidobacteriaceae bacterium]
MNFFSIRHFTRFEYSTAVCETMMETRMHPRTDTNQRCLSFSLSVNPRCRLFTYRDHLGNSTHHFDIPSEHRTLVIIAESLVELQRFAPVPQSLDGSAWDELDAMMASGDYWEMLLPSRLTEPTPRLLALAEELGVRRRDDPMTVLRELNSQLNSYFEYVPNSTRVDSTIDEAIEKRQGVCQDLSHTMIALVRLLGIPCRYVSGYLYHTPHDGLRSLPLATHAWVDAFLPHLGWVGFDPTNNVLAHDVHIRTALGRDYSDVPPTRGIYRGHPAGELHVVVQVTAHAEAPPLEQEWPMPEDWSIHVERALEPPPPASPILQLQQIEQQQQ